MCSSPQFDTVPDTTAFSNSVTLKGFTLKMEVKSIRSHIAENKNKKNSHLTLAAFLLLHHQEAPEAKCQVVNGVPAEGEPGSLGVGPLRRSVSQLMDGKTLAGDDEAWDPDISGHDSGMVRGGKNVSQQVSDSIDTPRGSNQTLVLDTRSSFPTC